MGSGIKMVQRIKISNKATDYLDKMQNKLHLSSKAAILRICISLSLNDSTLLNGTFSYDNNNGFDISLDTLFGDYSVFFEGLIKNHYKKEMTDKEYVEQVIGHIERGIVILYGEFATTNTTHELIKRLVDDYR
jgi:DNA sulfur modification protein DndE